MKLTKTLKNLGSKAWLLMAFTWGFGHVAQAQICAATNSYGCSIDWFDAVTIKNSKGQVASYSGLTCGNTGATNKLMTSGPCIDITPGEEIEMYISNGCTYSEWAGVFLDLNRDNNFQSSECISGPSGPFGQIAAKQNKTVKIKIPCGNQSSGTAILRVRCFYGSFTTSQGCGTINNYGNIMDFEVNILNVTKPTASISVPTGTSYVKSPTTFTAGGGGNWTYNWTFDQASTIISNKAVKGVATWNNAGTYDVKLVVDYCGDKDSAVSSVKIVAPTAAPNADFIADLNEVEQYYNVQLFDLSDNGAYKWSWELYSPTGADDQTATDQNPSFTLNEFGWYKVCLTSENDIGPSTAKCKSKYIECTSATEFYMGPSKEGNSKNGTLFDNGGPTANYGDNRKPSIDYFKILPCGAEKITLSFAELVLKDAGDKIRIYDAPEADPLKEVTPTQGITSTNQAYWDTTDIVLTSGAGYITFETNGAGNDKGFILNWKSKLGPALPPNAKWTTDYNPAANSMAVTFTNASTQTEGAPSYEWWVDQNAVGTGESYTEFFSTDGTYEVCLVAQTCNGNDTFCDNVTILTPNKPGALDYKADNVRPNVLDVVSFTTKTDYANKFEWNIFPTSFTYMNGTSASSQNPQIKFLKGGAYTFTLKAWNSVGGDSATQKKLIKNKYVIVLDYCTPLVSMMSADVAINTVTLENSKGVKLINSITAGGQSAYTSFTDTKYPAVLTFGSTYDLTVSRLTNSNPVNYKAWVDWNIDGDFTDAGEEVMSTGSMTGTSASATVKVPKLSQSFEGLTRLRVAASFSNFSNTPCGVNQVGEYEDYLLKLANDMTVPSIRLVGSDTIRVERGSSKTSCYAEVANSTYSASDPTEGDMTSLVVVKSDLDCTVPGVYSITFDVEDASGNKAEQRTRTVIVVLDRTAPVLTLNGNSTITMEQCDTYSELGAVANDAVDGNLTSAIQIAGSVDGSTVGDYTLVYTVKDAQGNTATATRLVQVRDTKKPGIYRLNQRITDGSTIDVQIKSPFVDEVYAIDDCNGSIFLSKNPGFNGPVNTQIRATYPITYKAKDPSGNAADEDGYTINYRVDDFIAPNIELNTSDTILHDVMTPYSSRNVTVSDNYYPLSQISITKSGTVDVYTLGTYEESYTAIDESGNSSTKSRFVKVVDRKAPEIIAPVVSACVGTPFWAMSGIQVRDNYYSSNDLMPLVEVVTHNVNIWQSGVYSITYQVTDPSGNSSNLVVREVYVEYPPNCFNTYMGVEEANAEGNLTVQPNPTRGEVTLVWKGIAQQKADISVINALGAVVYQLNGVENGFGRQTLDLSQLAPGMYTVRVIQGSEVQAQKLIINR